jgi:hypothetical protein
MMKIRLLGTWGLVILTILWSLFFQDLKYHCIVCRLRCYSQANNVE